jgi:hypothetical protein
MSDFRLKSLRIRFLRQRLFDVESKPIAQRALLLATELLSKAAGLARRKAGDSEIAKLRAEVQAANLRAHIAEKKNSSRPPRLLSTTRRRRHGQPLQRRG